MNLNDIPVPLLGEATSSPFTLDDDTQELPPLKADGLCANCNVFAATHGELCELCTDLLEVGNVD